MFRENLQKKNLEEDKITSDICNITNFAVLLSCKTTFLAWDDTTLHFPAQ